MSLFTLPFLGSISLEVSPRGWLLEAQELELSLLPSDTLLSTLYSMDLRLEEPLSQDETELLALIDSACLDLSQVKASSFRRFVWQAIAAVPLGQTVTYQALAQSMGCPRALQAVGTAVGANPFALAIPCQRVVRADGRLGHFALGSPLKAALLLWERRVLALR